MFTGIVEAMGTITAVDESGAQSQITIASPGFGADLQHGESVAVNGVCLTVARRLEENWVADVMRVTRETTTLGDVEAGDEGQPRARDARGRAHGRAHRPGPRRRRSRRSSRRDSTPEWDDLTFTVSEDGRALRRAEGLDLPRRRLADGRRARRPRRHRLADPHHAARHDVLGDLAVGDRVNVEVDVLAKYVERFVGGAE